MRGLVKTAGPDGNRERRRPVRQGSSGQPARLRQKEQATADASLQPPDRAPGGRLASCRPKLRRNLGKHGKCPLQQDFVAYPQPLWINVWMAPSESRPKPRRGALSPVLVKKWSPRKRLDNQCFAYVKSAVGWSRLPHCDIFATVGLRLCKKAVERHSDGLSTTFQTHVCRARRGERWHHPRQP